MLSFECIKNEKSVYFLLTSAYSTLIGHIRHIPLQYTHLMHLFWIFL